jgi:glycosyltransferase involved in cell wall biosynthesis
MSKLALSIIVKDELDQVTKILSKYAKFFDEVSLAVDFKYEEFIELKKLYPHLEVHQYTWQNDFAHKRNFLADKTKSDYYFRIDCDDDISNPELIRDIFNKMVTHNIDITYFHYDYSMDIDGNIDAGHWRESIIRKRSDIYWKKSVHENVFIEDQNKFKGIKDESIKIIHNIVPGHAEASRDRNWKILVEEYRRDKENTDPRTIAYLGRMLMGIKKYKEAIKFLELLVSKSGWDDDKYFAYIHLSQCFQGLGDIASAIASCNEALAIKPEFPDAYLQLGIIYIGKEDYKKAVNWLEIGAKKSVPDTLFVLDLSTYGYRVNMNLAIAYYGLGDYEKAWDFFLKSQKDAPNNEFVLHNEKLFKEGFENNKYIKNLMWIVQYTKDKDPDQLKNLVKALPKPMMKDERIVQLKNMYAVPEKWDEKSIVIYCGPAWEDWAAPSVLTGIGGSEEAVVYLSKELNNLGYKVTVYCSCGLFAGVYGNVEYKEYFEFNPRDSFNILIAWRHNIFVGDINARRKLIWLHDVPSPDMFPRETLNKFDKVIVLSEFHKSLLPEWLPADKVLVSSNGINRDDFKSELLARNPKRMIYTSSYDRGIIHLLKMWPDIKKEVPEAELHLFYGWNTYDSMVLKGARTPEFKNMMVKAMSQDGVFEHGRVGHKQLIKEFYKSGVYVYPSHFEEISCISAMKAQSCKCIPVTTNYAALAETVKYGIKIEGKAGEEKVDRLFKESLINILKDSNKQESIRKEMIGCEDNFSWARVAKQWEGIF